MQAPRTPIEAVTHPDPYPYYRDLRQAQPLFFEEGLGLWVASSYAAVHAALTHPALRVRPTVEPVPKVLQGGAAGAVFGQLLRMTDGAFHAAHKPEFERAANRWTLPEVGRAAQEACEELRPQLGVNEFVAALAVQTMARLLGVPADTREDTCRFAMQFAQGIAPGADVHAVALADQAAAALMQQGRALGLAPVQAANRIAWMQQAFDATAGLLGHTALCLMQEPAHAAQADQTLDAMRAFTRELERWAAPIQNTRRYAARALTLLGRSKDAGQTVLLLLASANRDPEINFEPDLFDPARAKARSMGFGSGAHACPGAAIAIEIVAACARYMRATGQFDNYFGPSRAFRPSPNARIPLF